MDRVRTQRDSEPIGRAFDLLPAGIQRRLNGIHFAAGFSPVFAGLHCFTDTEDGRSYDTTAHVVYPHHQITSVRANRAITVALPCTEYPTVIVHELGHALHGLLDFQSHDPDPVTDYAKTNRWEAFAEAFAAWVLPGDPYYVRAQEILLQDKRTLAFFDELNDSV
jgi:hypothetical protein